ncbi:tryptophan 7-halogenase [Croceicoccus ponticola]|uniref:Tryptophan 7-halogenase n=1 Tax=Croceicoccus ponticola TaxID=2217664 RepID=A0A437GWJ8_9SPHN|nr:tryptophan halogenase family protein [Croceicoccus ponticola]RVQ66469.1 tryptophan 7-halogenase [Croceicoccus ponticola]
MPAPITSITIVGGGTTGWLAAAFLATRFEPGITSGKMTITVVESPTIPIIGVGESLSPAAPETLKTLGVPERAFMVETDATFKLAGYFLNWDVGARGQPMSWVNPFIGYLTAGYEFERFELAGKPFGDAPDYAATISPCRDAIERTRGPRRIGQGDFEAVLRYAYHTDASRYAGLLKKVALHRGVVHVADDVVDVALREDGFVDSLLLAKGGRHPVELVIDATGFAGVILKKALGIGHVDYSQTLLNDRAAVIQLDWPAMGEIEPATRATALGHGWAFRVPLYHRTGNGYVYSSRFISDDDARVEFAAHLGDPKLAERMRIIPMRIGRASRNWVGNCIAMGLSSGFVEPLEASAIYTVETSLKWLMNYFPTSDFPQSLADRYNQRTAALYDEVVEYIALHYHLSNRADTAYWRAQRTEPKLPERLAENLAIWRHALPVQADVQPTNYFDHNTYLAALFGKGFYKGGELRPERTLDPGEWAQLRQTIDDTHRRAINALPGHRELLDSFRR